MFHTEIFSHFKCSIIQPAVTSAGTFCLICACSVHHIETRFYALNLGLPCVSCISKYSPQRMTQKNPQPTETPPTKPKTSTPTAHHSGSPQSTLVTGCAADAVSIHSVEIIMVGDIVGQYLSIYLIRLTFLALLMQDLP